MLITACPKQKTFLKKKVLLIRRPMIDFVLISDPRPYVVDTQVKRSCHPGDELNQMADDPVD